ncbi:MAG: DeoR/GlpR family DNA-binding transcription regulator [Anaerolineales bacterium]|nr:DeoR/GlpR family DNA-binding transcription regulator [Anaerolineales bacterium]
MTTHHRRQLIVDILRSNPGIKVVELAQSLGVSEGTIRNDLNALAQEGRIKRVRGGAVLNVEDHSPLNSSFWKRHEKNAVAKTAIARQAAAMVMDGDSILLDASSTVYYLAREILNRERLRVVTNGIEVAQVLARNPSNTVVLIGGIVDSNASSVTGLLSEQIIRELRVQKAFVSCSGFSLERGMTEVHIEEAQLKRKAVQAAQEIIALVDSSKIGKEDLTSFARPDQIAYLFTDAGIASEWVERIQQAGIKLVVCS